MQRYHFDVRDGEDLAEDEEGLELATFEEALQEARLSLSEIAREVLREATTSGSVSIEVRSGEDVIGSISVNYNFEMRGKRQH